jgi:thymidylate synthase
MPMPAVRLSDTASLFALEREDVVLEGYRAHPAIRAPIAI